MKVAIISKGKPTPKYPLNGIFEFDQAKALAQKGLEVAFIAIDFRIWTDRRKYGLLQYECEGVHVFELSLPINMYRRALPILQRLVLISFRAMLKSFGTPDIIHAHFYSIAAIASILRKKYGIPYIITEHSSKLNKEIEGISAIDKKLARKAYDSCDQIICVSEALRQNIKKNFQHDSIVIPNIVDDQSFNYQGNDKSSSPFVYVSTGSLKPIKNFDKLIDAFSQVKDDAQLLIIGEGPERGKLESKISELQLESHVKLLGQLTRAEINKIYQEAHVFVLPSQSETFGVSYIEAMYTGLPVIATRCGGPEAFVNESNGILVPVNGTTELTSAMENIRKRYSNFNPKQISESCFQLFSPSKVAEQIIEVYRSKSL